MAVSTRSGTRARMEPPIDGFGNGNAAENAGQSADNSTSTGTLADSVEALKLKILLAELQANENEKQRQENEREHERKLELMEAQRQIAEAQRNTSDARSQQTDPPGNELDEGKAIARWQSILNALTPDCDAPTTDLISFFKIVEEIFHRYRIPDEYHSSLILPVLKSRASTLLTTLTSEDLDSCEKIKATVLNENRLTPTEQRRRYVTARRTGRETHLQFVGRLRTLLKYYLQSKNAKTIEEITEVILMDQFKETLSTETRQYVELQTGTQNKTLEEMAMLADVHRSAQQNKLENGHINKQGVKGSFRDKSSLGDVRHKGEQSTNLNKAEDVAQPKAIRQPKCFACKQRGHVLRDCPERKYGRPPQLSEPARAQRVSVEPPVIREPSSNEEYSEHLTARVSLGSLCPPNMTQERNTNPAATSRAKLNPVTVRTKSGKVITGIIDSGCEMSVMNRECLDMTEIEHRGTVLLRPVFGPLHPAEQVEVQLELVKEDSELNLRPLVNIVAAVTPELNGSLLLTPSDYEILLEQRKCYTPGVGCTTKMNPGEADPNQEKENEVELPMAVSELQVKLGQTDREDYGLDRLFTETLDEQNATMNVSADTSDPPHGDMMSERTQLLMEQQSCPSLADAWRLYKQGKGGYHCIDGVLYHSDRIQGYRVSQLVLPRGRREVVLKMAHEAPFGAHLGVRKTAERILLSFFWPQGVRKDVIAFCNSCEPCQKRQVIRTADRTPIEAVQRPALPFQVVNIDMIGPFEPTRKKNKYILCMIDQHSHWAEAVPLENLSAQNTCEALLTIFMRTGIPSIVASDQGTNFTSGLTQEFERVIGTSPRFSTPGRPQSNGLVERYNRVMKGMLHHIIRDHPRDWDTHLPFLTWAYNEVSCVTTGFSPFQLLYGREPSGPLSILKRTWDGSLDHPLLSTAPVHQYVSSLKTRMEEAAQRADVISRANQAKYVNYYNTRSRLREYQEGDQVLVLTPDSSNKMLARWTGPAKVLKRYPPHSYLVAMPNQGQRHFHADKLRPFIGRTNTVGVIYDDDGDMGEVSHAPMRADLNPVRAPLELLVSSLGGLSRGQRTQLMEVLADYPELFSGNLRRVNIGQHQIRLKPGTEFKKPHLYRVPEALKETVDHQVAELLERGLIRPSESQYIHPLVCVKKKDGTIRLCVDYRALNSITESDQFPMEQVTDLIYEIGRASCITVLDMQKAYWQVNLDPSSQDLTSFATHQGLYAWRMLPFGLKGAPATFQRIINTALSKHRSYARAYLDDIAIFSNSWDEHLVHLHSVFHTLNSHEFSVNLKKSEFGRKEVRYLGHIVGSGSHRPDPGKLTAITGIKPPKTKRELRSFLGLCGYYREYIKGYAGIALPLTELTRKKIPQNIPWSPEANQAFGQLKDALCQAPALRTPDISQSFVLYCDASGHAVSGCLAQKDETGTCFPVSFTSAKLSPTQQKWSAGERKAFSIIHSLKKFEPWVFGTHVTVFTDHNPLKFLTCSLPQSPRLQRWSLAIQRFDLEICYRRGGENVNADALSRLPNQSWEAEI